MTALLLVRTYRKIVPTTLIAMSFLCQSSHSSVYSQPRAKTVQLTKTCHFITLLKTLLWLSISLGIKANIVPRTYNSLCDQTLHLWPIFPLLLMLFSFLQMVHPIWNFSPSQNFLSPFPALVFSLVVSPAEHSYNLLDYYLSLLLKCKQNKAKGFVTAAVVCFFHYPRPVPGT